MNMNNVFHAGATETVLFDWWKVESAIGMVASCLAIGLLCFVTETIRWIRTCISTQRAQSHPVSKEDTLRLSPTFSVFSIVDSVLMLAQLSLAYSLMLIFMYFNIWLCLAVIFGEVLSRLVYAILFPGLHSSGGSSSECG